MLSLLLWALILVSCFAFGAAVLRRLGARTEGLAEEAPFALALGLGALSYLVLAVGLLGWLRAWVGGGLIVLLAALGWRHLLRLPREALAGLRGLRPGAEGALVGGFVLLLGGLTALGALAPSGDMDYDGLFYHLTLPKLYLLHGRIGPLPWLTHSNFPFQLEMLYLLGLMLKGQALAKLFHFGCGWLTALALYAFGRRYWSPRAGALGAIAFVTAPFVVWELTSAYNELAFALFAFLSLAALTHWYVRRESGWLWTAAILCGLALGTKMLALALVLFAVGALLVALRHETARGRAAVRIAAFVALALAVGAPWYVKSYLWTGNPVYPFFYEVFGGKYWSLTRAQEYSAAQHAFGLGTGAVQFLLLPWNLTMHPAPFTDRGFSTLIASLGPLPLTLLPLLFLWRRWGAAGAITLGFAALYAGLWFGLSQNSRYLLPALPGLCAGVGLAADRLLARRDAAALGTRAVYGLVALYALGLAFLLVGPGARAAVGIEPPGDYLARTSRAYAVAQAVNEATPPAAKVMVLGDEPRMFYLERDFFLGNHAVIFRAEETATAAAFEGTLRRDGVTHVLLDGVTTGNVMARRGTMETRLAELIAARQLRLVRQFDTMSLWEIAPAEK